MKALVLILSVLTVALSASAKSRITTGYAGNFASVHNTFNFNGKILSINEANRTVRILNTATNETGSFTGTVENIGTQGVVTAVATPSGMALKMFKPEEDLQSFGRITRVNSYAGLSLETDKYPHAMISAAACVDCRPVVGMTAYGNRNDGVTTIR